MPKEVHACDGCAFFASGMCNYLLVMDVRRGSPAGAGCDKKISKKEFNRMGIPRAWDEEGGRRMWLAGKGDAEIAKACGVTQATISYFRRKHWEAEGSAECDVSGGYACNEVAAEAALAVPPEQHEAIEGGSMIETKEDIAVPEEPMNQIEGGVSREEYNQVVSWMVEAQRRADEAEAKVRKLEKVISRMAVALYGGD